VKVPKKVLKLTYLCPLYAMLSVLWLILNAHSSLIEIQSWLGFCRTLLVVTLRLAWLLTSVQLTITLKKLYLLWDMLQELRTFRINLRLMRTLRILWSESSKKKSQGWKLSLSLLVVGNSTLAEFNMDQTASKLLKSRNSSMLRTKSAWKPWKINLRRRNSWSKSSLRKKDARSNSKSRWLKKRNLSS